MHFETLPCNSEVSKLVRITLICVLFCLFIGSPIQYQRVITSGKKT